MFIKFLQLEWKAFSRSSSKGQEIAVKILLAIVALYMLASCLVLGFLLYPILAENLADRSPLQAVNGFLLVWMATELVARFFLQSLPTMNIKPLLVQPLKRSTVVHYVLIKSLFSFYNLPALLVYVPFALAAVKHQALTPTEALGWLTAVLGMLMCINYSNFLLKKKFTENIKQFIPYLVVVGVMVALEYFSVFKVTDYAGRLMDQLPRYPAFSVAPLLLAVALYAWNFITLRSKFYLDASLKSKVTEAKTMQLGWLDRFGAVAPFLKLDIKLLWRNKRPKTTLFLALGMLAYGLLFYTNPTFQSMPVWRIFIGVFMTGIFLINFGQFIPAWDSAYYPLMMAQNIPLKAYLRSKAALIYLSIVVLFLGTLPYAYFGYDIVIAHMVAAVYNAGINLPIILFSGSFNKKRIDLDKTVFMNYQGTGAAQWIVGIPVMVLPMLLWYIVYRLAGLTAAHLTLLGLGIIGLIFNGFILDLITREYAKRKYQTLNGFKQQEA